MGVVWIKFLVVFFVNVREVYVVYLVGKIIGRLIKWIIVEMCLNRIRE